MFGLLLSQLCVSKMRYDLVKGRGVQKSGQTGKKIFINRDSDYDTTLKRIREELYGENVEESITGHSFAHNYNSKDSCTFFLFFV